MAVLDVTRAYSDGEVLTEAQLDLIITDIEELFNSTLIDDGNIQNSGLTGSTVLLDGSVTGNKIQDEAIIAAKLTADSITTPKILDQSVTATKVALGAVTSAKLATNFLSPAQGAIQLFHTYNGLLSLPRGWMICNGDVVNETNYEAIHGASSYTEDGVASSLLLTKNLPDMTNLFAVGSATTTQDGSSAITTVGNTDNEVDINHSHTATGTSHTHQPGISIRAQKFPRSATVTPPYKNDALGIKLTGNSTFALSSTGSNIQNCTPENVSFIYMMRVI